MFHANLPDGPKNRQITQSGVIWASNGDLLRHNQGATLALLTIAKHNHSVNCKHISQNATERPDSQPEGRAPSGALPGLPLALVGVEMTLAQSNVAGCDFHEFVVLHVGDRLL